MHHIKICFSGVIPNADLLTGSGVEVDPRRAVVVDKVTLSLATTAKTDLWKVPVSLNNLKDSVSMCLHVTHCVE